MQDNREEWLTAETCGVTETVCKFYLDATVTAAAELY
jgi:hypothetical protein